MDQVELACPYCGGRFPAEAAAETRSASCPHCDRAVTVPAIKAANFNEGPPVPPPPVSASPVSEPAQPAPPERQSPGDRVELRSVVGSGEVVPLRRLSPEERARFRRRLNIGFAAAGMAILAAVLVLLLHLRP